MSNTFRIQDGSGITDEIDFSGRQITEAYAPSQFFAAVPADGTAGFAPGCVFKVLNAAAGVEFFINQGSTTSCAFRPDELNGAGSAALNAAMGSFNAEGNLYATAGNPIAGNGADTTDDILAGIRLPVNVFDQAGRSLLVLACGQTLNNTNNKRAKLLIGNTSGITYATPPTNTAGVLSGGVYTSGASTLSDTGAWVNGTTPNSNVGWQLEANVIKYGAAGSNTQASQGTLILGATHGGATASAAITLTENTTIDIIVTGSSYTSGNANDVKLLLFQVNWMN